MATAAAVTQDRIPWPVWRLSLVIVFGAFLSMLDAAVVNVGLDTMSTDLGATLGQVQWVASAYLIALAVSLPLCGWLGRKVGVGRLWLWALTAFTAASGLCALASDVGWLIGLRVLQGLAAGLLVPAGQTILGQAVGPRRLGRVMATLGIAVSCGPTLGPTVGGLILHHLSWEWLFLVNIPIGAIGLALGLRFVPRGEPGTAPPLDWLGFALIGTGLPLVVYGITTWGERGALTTGHVLVPLTVGAIGLFLFAGRVLRRADPMLDLRLFVNPVYAAAGGLTAFAGAAVFGASLLFPLLFQILRGAGVVETGLSLFALGLGTAVVLPLTGRLTDRYGGGIVSVVGNVLAVATTVPFAFVTAETNAILLQGLLLLRGAASGLAAVPAAVAAYATVRHDQLPDATTQVNILQRVGGALGGALFAVILVNGLPQGAESAFQTAFWWVTGATVVALAWSLWLWFALRARAEAQPESESGSSPVRTQEIQRSRT